MHLINYTSPTSPDNDMDETDMETNQTNPFEHEYTNDTNDDTMHTQNPS